MFDAFCNDPNQERDFRLRNAAFGASNFLEQILPGLMPRVQLALLAHSGIPVAGVVFIDVLNPLLGLIIPGRQWDSLRGVLRQWGDALWKGAFASTPEIMELESRVEICERQCEILDRHSLTPIPTTRLKLFDTTYDPGACPFLLADFRFAGAGVVAALSSPEPGVPGRRS